jgi:hypothetical protein
MSILKIYCPFTFTLHFTRCFPSCFLFHGTGGINSIPNPKQTQTLPLLGECESLWILHEAPSKELLHLPFFCSFHSTFPCETPASQEVRVAHPWSGKLTWAPNTQAPAISPCHLLFWSVWFFFFFLVSQCSNSEAMCTARTSASSYSFSWQTGCISTKTLPSLIPGLFTYTHHCLEHCSICNPELLVLSSKSWPLMVWTPKTKVHIDLVRRGDGLHRYPDTGLFPVSKEVNKYVNTYTS